MSFVIRTPKPQLITFSEGHPFHGAEIAIRQHYSLEDAFRLRKEVGKFTETDFDGQRAAADAIAEGCVVSWNLLQLIDEGEPSEHTEPLPITGVTLADVLSHVVTERIMMTALMVLNGVLEVAPPLAPASNAPQLELVS